MPPNEIRKNLIPQKLTTILYSINTYITKLTHHIIGQPPAFLAASYFKY